MVPSTEMSEWQYKVVVGDTWDDFFEGLRQAYDDGWENSPPSLDDKPRVRQLRRKIRK